MPSFTSVCLAMLFSLLFIGCATGPAILRQDQERSGGSESAPQLEMKRQLLSEACSLANTSGLREALDVCEFLKANLFGVRNVGPMIQLIEDVKCKKPVALLILTGNEQDPLPKFLAPAKNDSVLAFMTEVTPFPLIVFKDKPRTSFTRGLIMLEEGFLAKSTYSRSAHSSKPSAREMAYENLRASEFGMKILDKVGGEKYATLVNEQVERYIETDLSMTPGEAEKLRQEQLTAIDEIFGNPGEIERRTIWGQFFLEAKFRDIDRFIPDKKSADEIKATIFLK